MSEDKKSQTKHAGGRPTKYNSEICTSKIGEKIIEMMSKGASKNEVAALLDIDKETLRIWCEKHEEFSVLIKKGIALSECWWERKARKNLKNQKFNATLWYMNMKNRFGWRDKIETQAIVTLNHEEALSELE